MLFTHPVPPALAGQVDLLWYSQSYAAPHAWERVLPSGSSQLVIELAEGSAPPEFERLRTEVIEIETTRLSNVMGVVMRPGSNLFSPDVELRQLREHLQEAPSATAKFALLIADLEQRNRALPLHPAVACALAGGTAADTGFSRRWLSQRFKEQIGVSPKAYARLLRFQRVVQQVAAGQRIEWADVAADLGFADQAHLTHEFRRFSGLTPAAFLASHRPHANHVIVPG